MLLSPAQPQNKVETQEVPLSPLSLEPVPVARCVSTGGRPPARISWSSHLDSKAYKSQVPGPRPGTFTVSSFLTLTPSSQVDGQNVTCKVEHESFEEPMVLPVTLTVPCECSRVYPRVGRAARLSPHTPPPRHGLH